MSRWHSLKAETSTKSPPATAAVLGGAHLVGLFAEFRSHASARSDAFVQPVTEISMVLRGAGLVRRRASGETLTTHAGPGRDLVLSGGRADRLCGVGAGHAGSTASVPATHALLDYATERGFVSTATQSLRYIGGFIDPLLEQMGRAILAEMQAETLRARCWSSPSAAVSRLRLLYRYSNSSTRGSSFASWQTRSRGLSRCWIHPRHFWDTNSYRGMASGGSFDRFPLRA